MSEYRTAAEQLWVIQFEVASHFDISTDELVSKCRHHSVARARQAAYLVARRLGYWSYPEIGRAFNRDHSTIVYGVRKAEQLERELPWFADLVARAFAAARPDAA